MLVETKSCWLWWKPWGLASTFWREDNFLDALFHGDEHILAYQPTFPHMVETWLLDTWYTQRTDRSSVRKLLLAQFTRIQEWWLLNRLDTPTQGFLYFAKDEATYTQMRAKELSFDKYYLAQVIWDLTRLDRKPLPHQVTKNGDRREIAWPIMHHAHRQEQMIVCVEPVHQTKGRGRLLEATTRFRLLEINQWTARIEIVITQGVRHQIRAHMAALGYPIVGEKQYAKVYGNDLQLWSVGVEEK
jgi:23S rRNA-/tRNA-specific pseudouridylate synthase